MKIAVHMRGFLQFAQLANSALLAVVLMAIATLPASATDMICLPSHQMLTEQPVSHSPDHPQDCMMQMQQVDHGDHSTDTAQNSGDTATHCMPAIGTALTSHQTGTPLLAGILLQTSRWPLGAAALPSLALAAQDRPPQFL